MNRIAFIGRYGHNADVNVWQILFLGTIVCFCFDYVCWLIDYNYLYIQIFYLFAFGYLL